LCSPVIGRRLEALVAPTNDSGDTEVNLLPSYSIVSQSVRSGTSPVLSAENGLYLIPF
jgi:hypothetical protein